MKWFKHDSNANMDFKMQTLLIDYGLEGYGLYWYCIELIAGKIEEDNISFELEHDARIIARNTGSTVQRVEEMMKKFIDLGLFENSNGAITCLKLRDRLDKSMTSNPYLRKLITNLKVENELYAGYVYFILAENETVKRIKIGRSKNPHARINDLKKRDDCIGLNLSIMTTIKSEDCVSLETEMHRKFKHLNIKDEWFEYSDELINHIKLLRPDYVSADKIRLDKKRKEYIPPIPSELLSDYLKVRKAKKAGELTETAFKGIEREAELAGISTEDAIKQCCERGWVGFKASWIKPEEPKIKESFGWRNDDTQILKIASQLGVYTSGKSRFEILAAIDKKRGAQ